MKEYGGYLPFELPKKKEYFHDIAEKNLIRLNCGRSTFWYALKTIMPHKLYVPYLNCLNSTAPADELGIPYEYYKLSEDLLPKDINPSKDDAVLWVNYYGNANSDQIRKIAELTTTTNVIIDNCQAFFSKPFEKAYNCYSTRKFFGVSDGGYLIKENIEHFPLKEESSASYSLFLLSTIEKGTNSVYSENLKNEERLGKEVYAMSKLTRRILNSIDYLDIMKIRKRNMLCLHSYLYKYNEFSVNTESNTHIHYPLLIKNDLIREKLIQHHIYTPTWWRHVPSYFDNLDNIEARLSKYMLMIPIDQRYDENDMKDIADIIISEIERL